MTIDPNLEPAVDDSEADSNLVSQVSLSPVPLLRVAGRTALSRRIPGRDEEDEWVVDAGRVEDDEWKVEATPARRGATGEIPFSDPEPESVRMFRCREADDDMDGEEMGLSPSEDSTCGMVGRV